MIRCRRRALLLAGGLAAATVGTLLALAPPAYADNCSAGSVSDCFTSLWGALFGLLGALAAAAAVFFGGRGSSSSSSPGSPDQAGPGSSGPPPAPPPQYPWLDKVNPTHGTTNCVNTANAVDDALGGNPHPADDSSSQPRSNLDHGDGFWNYGTGDEATQLQQMVNSAEASGPGSRGYLWVERNGNGHVLNWVNDNGKVMFLDGQSGRWGDLSGPGGLGRLKDAVIANKADPTPLDFSWKRTHP
ncbi:MAG: toxin glutamine deamidase domain-containing protein [Acidimicrobiales bacterium]